MGNYSYKLTYILNVTCKAYFRIPVFIFVFVELVDKSNIVDKSDTKLLVSMFIFIIGISIHKQLFHAQNTQVVKLSQ